MVFDQKIVRHDFPILSQLVHGVPLVYLDSAATSQKPRQVIEAISNYYQTSNANVHRGVHALSDASTTLFEDSRAKVAAFFDAAPDELVVVRNTTEAINGVAYGWGMDQVGEGDVVIATLMDHHSSFVVWQQLAARKNAIFEVVGVTDDGLLDVDHLQKLVEKYTHRIKLVSFTHVSNTLGTVVDVEEVAGVVKRAAPQARLCLDAAQSAPHMPVSFAKLKKQGIDFMASSGHKMLGPMGIGCLFVRQELLASGSPEFSESPDSAEMKPWLFGGGMIASVSPEKTIFHPEIHERFTAGTPDVASLVGLAAACNYLTKLDMNQVAEHEASLVAYTIAQLSKNLRVKIIGPTGSNQHKRVGSVAFTYEGVHAHDVAQILDSQGVAVRSGHHCTMPLHTHFGWQATVRASFNVYTTTQDIDALVSGLKKVDEIFSLS